MRRFTIFVMAFIMAVSIIISSCTYGKTTAEQSNIVEPSKTTRLIEEEPVIEIPKETEPPVIAETFIEDKDYIIPLDKEECYNYIIDFSAYLDRLDLAKNLVSTKVEEKKITKEMQRIQSIINQYNFELSEFERWEQKYIEYPYATEIWLYLRDTCGFNECVCAGILGNIMAEVGGQTLNIQYWLGGWDTGFYGMCQWSLKFRPDAYGLDLQQQCEYLADTMKYEIDMFGFCYYSGFNYEAFLQLDDPNYAALAFAKTYERGSSASNYIRQKNAMEAYEYFTN